MKSSTKDQIKGKFHEVKGKAKQEIGQAANDPDTQMDGQAEKTAGKVQQKVGQIKKVFNK